MMGGYPPQQQGRGGRGGGGRGGRNNFVGPSHQNGMIGMGDMASMGDMGGAPSRGRGGRSRGVRGGRGGATDQQLCRNYVSGSCQRGDQCAFPHLIMRTAEGVFHANRITGLADGEGKLFSAGMDGNIVCFQVDDAQGLLSPPQPIPTGAPVTALAIAGSSPIWAVESRLLEADGSPAFAPVGSVSVLPNISVMTTVAVKKPGLEYTQIQPVRALVGAMLNGVFTLLIGGGNGQINIWRYDSATSSFAHAGALEGHTREISSMLVHGDSMWSGSSDATIIGWNLTNFQRSVKLCGAAGHVGEVLCLAAIT